MQYNLHLVAITCRTANIHMQEIFIKTSSVKRSLLHLKIHLALNKMIFNPKRIMWGLRGPHRTSVLMVHQDLFFLLNSDLFLVVSILLNKSMGNHNFLFVIYNNRTRARQSFPGSTRTPHKQMRVKSETYS